MKSSTIRRSTLSRETMEVIENLAKENENEGGLGEYVRPEEIIQEQEAQNSKAQEIDLLWQNFKATQFNTNSPTAYILLGFVIGVVTTLVIGFCCGLYVKNKYNINTKFNSGVEAVLPNSQTEDATLEQQAQSAQEEVNNKVSIPTEDEVSPAKSANSDAQNSASAVAGASLDKSKMKKYVVKNGDTGESIIKHYFGSYSPEKAELIKKVNNLDSLDRINIDQELWIPVE